MTSSRDSSFSGRRQQSQRLDALFGNVANDATGSVAIVTGSAGAGKSRLIEESAQRAAANLGVLVPMGECADLGEFGASLLPFRQMLRDLEAADADVEPPSRVFDRRRFANVLKEVLPNIAWALNPAVGLVTSAAAGVGPSEASSSERSSLFAVLHESFERLARERPLVLIVDDVQWADSISLDLLHDLIAHFDDIPIGLIFGVRTEDRDAEVIPKRCLKLVREAQRRHGDVIVRLGHEKGAAARHFVEDFVAMNYSPNHFTSEFIDRLAAVAGDNALYLQEFMRQLEARQALRWLGDEWVMQGDADTATMPAKIEGILQARVDEMSREALAVARVAATEGTVFHAQIVASALGRPVEEVTNEIIELLDHGAHVVEQRDLVTTAEGKELYRFEFVHNLFPLVLLKGSGSVEGIRLHRSVLRALDEWLPSGDPDALALRFDHAYGGHEVARAAALAVSLGQYLIKSYSPDAAVAVVDRALSLEPDLQPTAWLKSVKAEALELLGKCDHSEELTRQIQPALEATNIDPKLILYAHHVRSVVLSDIGRFDEAKELATQVVRRAAEHDDAAWQTVGCMDAGRAAESQGAYEESVTWLRRALTHVTGDNATKAAVLEKLGYSLSRWGHLEEAESCYHDAIERARLEGMKDVQGTCMVKLAVLRMTLGHFADAVRLTTQSLDEVLLSVGTRLAVAQTLSNRALANAFMGNDKEATADITESLYLLTDIDDSRHLAIAVDVAGTVALLAGRLDDAEASYLRAYELSKSTHDQMRIELTANNLVALAYARRDLDMARLWHQRCISTREPDQFDRAFTLTRQASVAALLGDDDTASGAFAEAATLFGELNDVRHAARAAANAAQFGAVELGNVYDVTEDDSLRSDTIPMVRT